jgi:colanic acid biosynthesis glycosyl transferase WcaI
MERMKITIWGINYAPEPTGIAPYNTDLCEYLQDRGHEVRMVTGFPYYPNWEKQETDRGRLFRHDTEKGIDVFRCWQYVPARPTALKRMIHEATFILFSFLRLLLLPRPDLLIVISPPLALGPAAWMIGLIKRCPYFFHVQDMQPDAAVSLGLLKPGKLTRLLYAIERFTYARAGTVSGITTGMLKMFTEKGVPREKQYLWPNWITSNSAAPTGGENLPSGAFRRHAEVPAEDFLVVYSGNLGKKQGLDVILDAARLIESQGHKGITFIIAGEGAEASQLRARIAADSLPVRLLPLQPEKMFRAMLKEADLCMVTQQKGSGALFFPSKLITLLSAACPVVTVADDSSELSHAVEEGGFGVNVLPEDPDGFARAILDLAARRSELPRMGAAGKEWVSRFARPTVLDHFAQQIEAPDTNQEAAMEFLAHERK